MPLYDFNAYMSGLVQTCATLLVFLRISAALLVFTLKSKISLVLKALNSFLFIVLIHNAHLRIYESL
jgi:hypothetical protein